MTSASCDVTGKFPAVSSADEGETGRIGAHLAENLYPGLLVMLRGDLGAGKTSLVRSVASRLGVSNIKSPTFSIESVHKIPDAETGIRYLLHADLYRVEDVGEFSDRFEEELNDGALLFVEWGERWSDAPRCDRWDIDIFDIFDMPGMPGMRRSGENGRIFEMSAFGERAIAALSNAFAGIIDPCR